jgi:hypothetical protein
MSASKPPAKASADARANGQDLATGAQSPPNELDLLHRWQSSPAGVIAGYVVGLVSTSVELKRLSGDPVMFCLIAAEVADLELINAEIGQLISRIRRTKGIAA